ncbi:hypothetical protein ILYODFUR_036981 [Ilyodon furcidens]|uniref:Uncharacterized protein n=1 Tax=Ilyodon furcidens TaxID=33524 RepID=A0ABV0UBH7_9TELE
MKMVMLRIMLSQVKVFLMLTAKLSRGSRSSRIKSSLSSTSSARVKAEADMAALKARHKLLKQKHALEEQKEQLRRKKEELDLETEIAASMAKVEVFQGSVCSQVISAAQIMSDGMNSYFESENKRSQMSNVDADTFVPTAAITDYHNKAPTFQSYSYLGA